MSQKKKWSAATKFEIALAAIKNETTINDICKRYEVGPSQVHEWKKRLLEQGRAIFAMNNKAEELAAAELERKQSKLYEKIGQLTVERDFLKKVWGKSQKNSDESSLI
jgi:transposase